ncbi:MAG: 3-dehydroquinate dehydratase [Bradyrhizobium sp.]|uniref:type II 3-dehydroquinate dehydratase n=1 Tax=Bradyrhizobium sp. TaxID=376 RepID=UPI001DAA24AE|nr:type II 3-dehydroquinate dehydratase [Bradyrhizobium sp.]MBV9564846.1 3-dehydroquinate dehydratase [Bradyrhizobium sp.]
MTGTILVLNGPNLNLLGVREPELYGHHTLEDIRTLCVERASSRGLEVDFRQSNSEATLIDWLHEARGMMIGVAINPAGLSFHSVPLLDAVKMFDGPKVEVHITNIHRREPMYQKSLISHGVTGVIAGLGASGYALAIEAIAELAGSART